MSVRASPEIDQERAGPQLVLGVLHAARRAQRHLLGGVLQAHADVLAVAEVVAHQRGQELDRHHGLGEPVPLEQQQHVLHDRLVHHRQQRLGLVGGHRAQPGALPARHHHCLHLRPVSLPLIRHISHHFTAAGHGSWPACPRPRHGRVPAPGAPSRPRRSGPPRQAAGLLQVQHGGPPVQGSSPDREGPTGRPAPPAPPFRRVRRGTAAGTRTAGTGWRVLPTRLTCSGPYPCLAAAPAAPPRARVPWPPAGPPATRG